MLRSDNGCFTTLNDVTLLHISRQMYNAVNNRRKEIYGEAGDVSKLVLHHMVNRKQSSFHEADTWVDDKGVQSNLIFGNPHLFHLLKYPKLRVHIDATFKVCPRTHLQCLIWSIQDKGSEMHIPIFYVLMTTKSQEAYERALTSIKHISGKTNVSFRYTINGITYFTISDAFHL